MIYSEDKIKKEKDGIAFEYYNIDRTTSRKRNNFYLIDDKVIKTNLIRPFEKLQIKSLPANYKVGTNSA